MASARPRTKGAAVEAIDLNEVLQGTIGVVFSRDRAMQLDATLRSLVRHCSDLSLPDLHVLYAASSPRFRRQYLALAQQWQEYAPVSFHEEHQFRRDLLRIVGIPAPSWREMRWLPGVRGRKPRAAAGWQYVLFLVDDNIFVRTFSLGRALQSLSDNPHAVGFSLRLGRNTTECYPLSRPQALPPFTRVGDDVLAFDWTRAECDFGYPLELSSSIYRSDTVAPLLRKEAYSSPNTLESRLSAVSARWKAAGPHSQLLCFERSVAFCNAINKVQTTYDNRSGESPSLTTDALADSFDAGMRIDIDAFSGFTPDACHCEVPLTLTRPASDKDGPPSRP